MRKLKVHHLVEEELQPVKTILNRRTKLRRIYFKDRPPIEIHNELYLHRDYSTPVSGRSKQVLVSSRETKEYLQDIIDTQFKINEEDIFSIDFNKNIFSERGKVKVMELPSLPGPCTPKRFLLFISLKLPKLRVKELSKQIIQSTVSVSCRSSRKELNQALEDSLNFLKNCFLDALNSQNFQVGLFPSKNIKGKTYLLDVKRYLEVQILDSIGKEEDKYFKMTSTISEIFKNNKWN